MKGRHDLGIAQAELDLKAAELAYAAELLDRSVIRAERAGIAVYADQRSLLGRPVAPGQRIMEIADPAEIEARIGAGGDRRQHQRRTKDGAAFAAPWLDEIDSRKTDEVARQPQDAIRQDA
jgi:hypothetical protein